MKEDLIKKAQRSVENYLTSSGLKQQPVQQTAPTQTTQYSSTVPSYSFPSTYQNSALTVQLPTMQQTARQQLLSQPDTSSQRWYSGSVPTTSETLARIYSIGQTDRAKADQLYNSYIYYTQDPSSPLYNPYTAPTNKAVSELRNLGVNIPATGITSQWIEANRGLLNNARYTTTGDAPASPTKNSSAAQNAAYWYYQILVDEDRTQRAEQEWKALQEEIGYWANRYDRNYSDEEILNRIDWSNYKTLAAMDDSVRGGKPMSLNRSVGYTRDNLYGAIWAARNNKTTGDPVMDAVSYRLGYGDSFYANQAVQEKLDPTSPNYNPYSVGSTSALDDAALYFGQPYFDKDWLQNNRSVLASNDKTALKMYNKVYDAEQFTLAAEAELNELNDEIEYWSQSIHNPKDLEEIIFGDNSKYKTLKKMDESLKSGEILATTRAIDYSRADAIARINELCKDFSDKSDGREFAETTAETLGVTPKVQNQNASVVDQNKDAKIQETAPYIAQNGTEAENDVMKYAYNYNFDNYTTMLGQAVADGTMTAQQAYDLNISYTNQYAYGHYFDATKAVKDYEYHLDQQKVLAQQVEDLRTAYNEALTSNGDRVPVDLSQMTPDEIFRTQLITYQPDPQMDAVRNAQTALEQAEAKYRENEDYLQNHSLDYSDAQKELKKINDSYDFAARIAALGGVEQNQEDVYQARAMLDVVSEFSAPPERPEINSYSAYDYALQNGASADEVRDMAYQSSLGYIAGIEGIDQILEWITANNVKVDDSYIQNLQATKEIYQDQVKDTAYYMLRDNEDMDTVTDNFKQELRNYWKGLSWFDKSFGERKFNDHALALIDPSLAGVDTDSMIELSGNAARRGNILGFTKEEQNTYLYLYAKEGEQAAEEYYNFIKDRTDVRGAERLNQTVMEMVGGNVDNGVEATLSTLGAILASPLRIIGSLYSVKQLATGEEINPKHWAYSFGNTMDQLKSQSKEQIKAQFKDNEIAQMIADFGYDAGTSALESAYSAFLGQALGLTSIVGDNAFGKLKNSSSAFVRKLGDWLPKGLNSFMGASLQGSYEIGSTAQDLSLRGVRDPKDIALLSGINFLAETLTESLEVSDILGIDDAATFKKLWADGDRINAILTAFQIDDAVGEALSKAITGLSDSYITKELSEYNLNTEDGVRQFLNDILYSAAEGMVSAELSHLAGSAVRKVGESRTDRKMRQVEQEIDEKMARAPRNTPTDVVDEDADLSDMVTPEEKTEAPVAEQTTPETTETGMTVANLQPTIDFDYGMKVKTENGDKTLLGIAYSDGSDLYYVTDDGQIVSQKSITGMSDEDLAEINRIVGQQDISDLLVQAQGSYQNWRDAYNQQTQPVYGPQAPSEPYTPKPESMAALRQVTVLMEAMQNGSPASKTNAVASLFYSGDVENPVVFTAAVNFMKEHSDDMMQLANVWLSAAEADINYDAFRTAMFIAMAGDGVSHNYLNMLMSKEDYSQITKPEIETLIKRAMMDTDNPSTMDRIQARTSELERANETKKLIGDGALDGTESYKAARDQAKKNADDAHAQKEKADREAQAAGENLKAVEPQYLENPSDNNLKGAYMQGIKDVEGKIIVQGQMEQHANTADQKLAEAEEAYNNAYNTAITEAREQAEAQVQQKHQAAAEASQAKTEEEAARRREEAIAKAAKGYTGKGTDAEGNPVNYHYEVIDSDVFDRGEFTPEEQALISNIAATMRPTALGMNVSFGGGAPLVNADYTIEDGRKRLAAIQEAKDSGKGLRYLGWLKLNADKFGIFPGDVNSRSVLVRVRDDAAPAAPSAAVNETAQPTATGTAPVEQAAPAVPGTVPETTTPAAETTAPKAKKGSKKTETAQPEVQKAPSDTSEADAGILNSKLMRQFTRFSKDGRIGIKDNLKFIKGFLSKIPAAERSGLVEIDPTTKAARLNAEGERRIMNAMYARAYGKPNDTTIPNNKKLRNLAVAMINRAPIIAMMNGDTADGNLYNYDLGNKLKDAYNIVKDVINGNMTVDEYLDQGDLNSEDGTVNIDPVTEELAKMLYRTANNSAMAATSINDVVKAIYDQGKPAEGAELPDGVKLIQDALGLEDEEETGRRKINRAVTGGSAVANGTGTGKSTVKNSPYRTAKTLAKDIGIGEYFDKLIDRQIRENEPGTQGYYEGGTQYVSTRATVSGNIHEPFHEIGHAIADKLYMKGTQDMVNSLISLVNSGQSNLDLSQYSPSQLEDEAFAEFFARYIRDPQLGVQFAGDGFVRLFEKRMQDNGMYDAVQKAAVNVRSFLDADMAQKIGSIIKDRSEASKKPMKKILSSLVSEIIDNSNAAEGINKVIREQTDNAGPEITADVRARALERNFAQKRVSYLLTEELTDPDGNVVGDSLSKALEVLNGKDDFDLFCRYGLAKHAIDRHAHDKVVLSEDIFGDGTNVEALVKDVELNHRNIKAAFDGYQKFRTEFLQTWMVDTGFMSQKTLDTLNKIYPNYVPTYTVEGRVGNKIEGAKGSTQDKINPMDSFIDMVNNIVEMNMKNRVAMAFHNAYNTYDNLGQFGAKIEGPNKTSTDIIKDLMDGTMSYAKITGLSQTDDTNQPNVIAAVLPDGSKAYYQVNDQDLFKLLTNTGPGVSRAYQLASKSVGALTRTMSKLTTGSNPLFAFANAVRDFQNSVNYGSWATTYVDGLFKWVKSFAEVWGQSDKYKEYAALGGGGWTRFDTANKDATNEVRNELVKGYHPDGIGKKVWNLVTLDRLNEVIEQTSRFAEYRFGKNDTSSTEGRQRAFLAAQEATVDFARQGNTKVLNILAQIVPFLKASTQGVYRTARMFTEGERGRLGARMAKTIFNTALTSALLNALLLKHGDDKEKEDFINMADGYKTQYYTLPNFAPEVFGNKDLIRLPVAQDPMMYAVHSWMTNAMWKGSTDQLAIDVMSIADAVIDNLNPIGDPVWSVLYDMGANRNYYGSPIVPKRLEDLESSNRYTETTPGLFIDASRGINAALDFAGAGSDVKNFFSPLNLQYAAQQYSGFIGQMVIPSISNDKHTGEMVGIMGAVNAARNRFTVDPTVSTKLTSVFYDNREFLTQVTKAASNEKPLNMLRRGLSPEEANQAVADAKALISKGGAIQDTYTRMNEIYGEIDEIQANQMLSDADKVSLIKEKRREINSIILDSNEAMEAYRQKYITGRNVAESAMFEGVFADKTAANAAKKNNEQTMPKIFKDDMEQDYMKQAYEVYRATGKDSALPHPSYTMKIEGKEYTVPDELKERYNSDYRIAYMKYMREHSAKWSTLSDEEKLTVLQGAHQSAGNKAKNNIKQVLVTMNR